jgi:hypothetical protein
MTTPRANFIANGFPDYGRDALLLRALSKCDVFG